MKLPVINSIDDVVARQLCSGCGACAYMDPDSIEMVDVLDHGRRPVYKSSSHSSEIDKEAIKVCPGVGLEHTFDRNDAKFDRALMQGWGPVLEIWEGHATDEAIRFAGSSGGAASAISLACIEKIKMHGVLHIKARKDAPIFNETVLSTTRDEILSATGSRYAPASPCDSLQLIEDAPAACVFIGKPCDVAAANSAAKLRPKLKEKLGLTIAFFCAGTPTTNATINLLKRMGIEDPSSVKDLRYRGNGWPGKATAKFSVQGRDEIRTLSYEESWGEVLTNDKQWRCHVCADHTGEFADIAVGDPWYGKVQPNEAGRSLIVVRTARGQRMLRNAMEAGYLTLKRVDSSALTDSQPNLLRGRGAVWARALTCRLMRVAAPRYRGFPMFRFWLTKLTFNEKIRSIAGTIKRVTLRKIGRPINIHALDAGSKPYLKLTNYECEGDDLLQLTEKHSKQLCDLCRSCFPSELRWQLGGSLAQNWWDTVRKLPTCETWVSIRDNIVCGFVVLVIDEPGWAASASMRSGSTRQRCIAILKHPWITTRHLINKRKRHFAPVKQYNLIVSQKTPQEQRTWVELIAVAPEYRGQGVGARLLKHAEFRTQQLNRQAVQLTVGNANHPAVYRYAQSGYGLVHQSDDSMILGKRLARAA